MMVLIDEIREQQISDFLEEYALKFNRGLKGKFDIEGTAESFANCFVAANPLGIVCGKNDDQFRKSILQGYDFYRNIGITSMKIISKEATFLDSFHTMIAVCWRSNFSRKDGSRGQVDFKNIYFVQTKENKNRIFGYITGDEQKALKENGLI